MEWGEGENTSLHFPTLLKIRHPALALASPKVLKRFCQTQLRSVGVTVSPVPEGREPFMSSLAGRFTRWGELRKVPASQVWRPSCY